MARLIGDCGAPDGWRQAKRGDAYLRPDGIVFRMDCDDPEHLGWIRLGALNPALDLSPLAKFMGKGRGVRFHDVDEVLAALRDCSILPGDLWDHGDGRMSEAQRFANGVIGWRPTSMYGWPIDPPAPEPIQEPSPMDKALDDFIAKRKAKRALPPIEPGMIGTAPMSEKQWNTERALDRAMSKLAPHEVAFHERLMPYRGAEL